VEFKDYYKILGVEKTAGKDQLKKQYRKLARTYHPDVNTTDKNAALKFSDISEAYNVLIDDDKRKKYDELGMDWEQHQTQNSEQANSFDWSKYASRGNENEGTRSPKWEDLFGMGSGTSDFFKTIFGQEFRGRDGAQFASKGQDLNAELPLSLQEAYEGGTKVLSVGTSKIRIKLLPGIWDRQRIKIDGKGLPGANGAESGDLYITFLLKPDPEYRLDGVNLYKDIPLSIYSALLGSDQVVQTISGKFELKIPPGTKNGTVFRLKGRGFPIYGKSEGHGDLFLKMVLKLPEKLTEQEKALFRELAGIRQEKVAGGER
jgi:curved DNA-binding protein